MAFGSNDPRPQFAKARSNENGVYPWEIVDLSTGRPVVRTSTEDAADRCLAELRTKGYIEVDL